MNIFAYVANIPLQQTRVFPLCCLPCDFFRISDKSKLSEYYYTSV